MRRTRETINYSHPSERWNISGALVFDGEDRSEEQRRRQNQAIQKEWLQQQMIENKRQKDLDREHEM